jgi:hypothetical protein
VQYLHSYLLDTGEEALQSLAESLGNLPLALTLAARYLRDDPGLSVDAYLPELQSVSSHLLDHESVAGWAPERPVATAHNLDLRSTFAISWQRVQDPLARHLFKVAGWCAPDHPIPAMLVVPALVAGTYGTESLHEYSNWSSSQRNSFLRDCRRSIKYLDRLALMRWEDLVRGPVIHPLLANFSRSLDTDHSSLLALLTGIDWITNVIKNPHDFLAMGILHSYQNQEDQLDFRRRPDVVAVYHIRATGRLSRAMLQSAMLQSQNSNSTFLSRAIFQAWPQFDIQEVCSRALNALDILGQHLTLLKEVAL